MTTFQYIALCYVLIIFGIKALLHTLAALGGQTVTSTVKGNAGNFLMAVLDWSVIFALIGVLF